MTAGTEQALPACRVPWARLFPLFLVSFAAVGFEISLTRYFAIASWSEYGYWVISITMVGFAVSGIVMSLFKDGLLRHGPLLMRVVPILLMLAGAGGYHLATRVPFNPLELQNRELWQGQLWNIGKYYATLFPFFFLAGLYISLNFLTYEEDIGRVYGLDLAGASAGATAVLVLMFVIHPFYLLAALLPMIAVAALLAARGARRTAALAAVALCTLAACEVLVVGSNGGRFNEYKPIYAPMHVPEAKVAAQSYTPQGLFVLLDDFTERLDTDFSNNSQLLQAAGPPRTFGLYADGNRLTSLAKSTSIDWSYTRGTLDAIPYALRGPQRVLLVGTSGGFRAQEALRLGAHEVVGAEPEEPLRRAILEGFGPAHAVAADPRVTFTGESPLALPQGGSFDLIDIDGDFLGQAETNKFVYTVESLAGLIRRAGPRGVVSLPVSIREFTVYAVKAIATVREALLRAGIADPGRNVIVYRSAWNARILASAAPWSAEEIRALRSLCDERSFDVSYFPGIDPAHADIYNDLPVVSFDAATVESAAGPADAIMDEAVAILGGGPSMHHQFFDLRPATFDRPFFFATLRLSQLRRILERIDLVPREEIGSLINVAVLVQSLGLAVLVLMLPLVKRRGARPSATVIGKSVLYFAALGIGFLFIEIHLIERAAFYFNDRSYAFAVVLAGMLVFSGLGSLSCARYYAAPRRGVRIAVGVIVVWCLAAYFLLPVLVTATLSFPLWLRIAALLSAIAPVSFALGFPFPLGLSQFRGPTDAFLPWAWSLNGAFSVISTPLANLIALSAGLKILLLLALALYLSVSLAFPQEGRKGSI